MTQGQIALLQYWAVAGSLLLAAVITSFLEIENQQFVMLLLFALFGIFSVFQDFSYYKGYGGERERMGEFIASHPRLKLWMLGFSIIAVPCVIYQMQTDDGFAGAYFFLSFLLLFGPVVYVSEKERFQSMSSQDGLASHQAEHE